MTAATDVSTSTDEDLVRDILAGQLALYEPLMRRNNRRVYRAAVAILRDDAEAEDVMQDAYVRAFEHLREFDGRARFSTWLTRIAVNEALARTRRRRQHAALDPLSEDSDMPHARGPSPEQTTSDREMRGVLERAIRALPDDFRAVFMLRAVEEMSGAETAEALGIPEDTVRTRLHRARGRLQELLLAELEPRTTAAFEFQAPRCDRVVSGVFHRLSIRSRA